MKKYTLNDCSKVAESKGGKCLSLAYVNKRTKMSWICVNGHTWDAVFDEIRRGSWCNICGREEARKKRLLPIEDLQKMAIDRGGLCLSSEYIGSKQKLQWQCSKNHVWYSTRSNIAKGSWCPLCAIESTSIKRRGVHSNRNALIDCKKIAEANGGECLSSEYINSSTKLLWKCEKSHEWFALIGQIKQGSWCPECRKNSLEDCYKYAEEKGGKCLSDQYINVRTPLIWQCKNNHIWQATYACVYDKNWCLQCMKKNLDDCNNIARLKNGKCISDHYINSHTKLEWECENGHHFFAHYQNIKSGRWCPECKYPKQEAICKKIVEMLFEEKFVKIRPNWLKNPESGLNLEIDMFSEKLNLAIEYNGGQHYKMCTLFHNTEEDFLRQQKKDKLKEKLILKKGISLIVVPYTKQNLKMFDFILKECQRLGLDTKNKNYNKLRIEIENYINTV